ncbi:MAG: protein phosphatase 2C domain-containing protein [Cyclobacteriaceae bacterium]
MSYSNQALFAHGSYGSKNPCQDFSIAKYLPEKGWSIIAVADGLGSSFRSDEASRFVCENLIEVLATSEAELPDLAESFELVRLNMIEEFEESIKDKEDTNALATTLICCVETPDEFFIGYAGNGGAFHIRSDFNKFPKQFFLPWNSVNLLNPHTVELNGKEALYKLVSPFCSSLESTPTVIRLSKDSLKFGEFIMLCTDGIYSYDHVQIGKDPNGKIWISGEESMEMFYDVIREFLNQGNLSSEVLGEALDSYLKDIEKRGLLTDDVSVAVIVSKTAKENWNKNTV